jgi:flagellar assembly factor FliW
MTDHDTSVIRTPDGLPGFAQLHTWQLEKQHPDAVFSVLRAVDEPAIGLLVAEPWELAPGYEPDLPEAELFRIGITQPSQVAIVVVATLSEGDNTVWLNLAAPIAINVDTREARQIILDRQGWPLRHPVAVGG